MISVEVLEDARRKVLVADEVALHQYLLSSLKQRLRANTLVIRKPQDALEIDALSTSHTESTTAAEIQMILSRSKSSIFSHVNTADLDATLLEMRSKRQIENRPFIEASKVRWGFRDRVLEQQKKILIDEAETRNDIETIELARLQLLSERLFSSDLTNLALFQRDEEVRRRAIETSYLSATLYLTGVLHRGCDGLELLMVGDLASPERTRRAVASMSPERLSPRRAERFAIIAATTI
jgi:hypothetical protein